MRCPFWGEKQREPRGDADSPYNESSAKDTPCLNPLSHKMGQPQLGAL
jgi:hypothetical protein